jgi:flagellin-specific chaperone FliS
MVNPFSDPFEVCTLGKKFIKKDAKSKDRVPNNTEEIDNSLRGLFNYLTAPNIRSKIKHPLFLAMKFNMGIKMYLRHKDFDTENQEKLIKMIHETVASSVEMKNEVLETENTKICL